MKSALDDIKKAEKGQKRYTELTDKKNKKGGKLSKKEEKELERLTEDSKKGTQAQDKYKEAQTKAMEAVTATGKAMEATANRQKELEKGLHSVDTNISRFGDHLKDVAGNSLDAQEGLHRVAEKAKGVGAGMEEGATKILGFS